MLIVHETVSFLFARIILWSPLKVINTILPWIILRDNSRALLHDYRFSFVGLSSVLLAISYRWKLPPSHLEKQHEIEEIDTHTSRSTSRDLIYGTTMSKRLTSITWERHQSLIPHLYLERVMSYMEAEQWFQGYKNGLRKEAQSMGGCEAEEGSSTTQRSSDLADSYQEHLAIWGGRCTTPAQSDSGSEDSVSIPRPLLSNHLALRTALLLSFSIRLSPKICAG